MHPREYLHENSMSVEALANRSGISRRLLYAFLSGEKGLSAKSMRKLHKASDGHITPNDILGLHPKEAHQTASLAGDG